MNLGRLTRWALCGSTALTLLAGMNVPTTSHDGGSRVASAATAKPLLFCADPDYMPYSNRAGEGFENKIAQIVGKALGRPVAYYWRSEREKDEYGEFITATIGSRNCDILVDVPYALQQVKTTRPYFTSSYVFVYKRKRGYALTSLDSPALTRAKLGYEGETPVAEGLKQRTLLIGAKPFFTADDEAQSPSAIVDAIESNKIDIGMTWDPAVGYFLKDHPDLIATTIGNSRTQGYPEQFNFPMSMATREKDTELNAQLSKAVFAHTADIAKVLRQYNIAFSIPDNSGGS